jgi:hypothetical protein
VRRSTVPPGDPRAVRRAPRGLPWAVTSSMVEIEDICDAEWAEWYLLDPRRRWAETEKLWETYLALGGSLDPEPDTQSPFFDAEEWREVSADGGTGVRAVRRSGV